MNRAMIVGLHDIFFNSYMMTYKIVINRHEFTGTARLTFHIESMMI